MKTKALVLFLAAGLFLGLTCVVSAGETAVKPYIGVRLNHVPDLLRKHLKLGEQRGLLVQNVQVGSPADQAGLEQDDIVISLDGQPVESYQQFVDDVQRKEVGTGISLEVIHCGDVKVVPLTLAKYREPGEWKYPMGPGGFDGLRPGRVFRLQPGQRDWEQIPFGSAPEMKNYFKRFFQQKHSYQSSDGKLDLEITIEGDPKRDDVKIKVEDRKEQTTYETTADEIDQLPEKYRQPVEQILDDARDTEFGFDFDWPQNWPDDNSFTMPFFHHWQRDRIGGDDFNDEMQGQMKELIERMEQMEKDQQEMLERMKEYER